MNEITPPELGLEAGVKEFSKASLSLHMIPSYVLKITPSFLYSYKSYSDFQGLSHFFLFSSQFFDFDFKLVYLKKYVRCINLVLEGD